MKVKGKTESPTLLPLQSKTNDVVSIKVKNRKKSSLLLLLRTHQLGINDIGKKGTDCMSVHSNFSI